MATAQDHLKQVKHNKAFLAKIDEAEYPDWAATVIFYIAVHLVQRLFAINGWDCENHSRRNKILREHFPTVWDAYQRLYIFSRTSRYRCMTVKPSDISELEHRLNRVEDEIEKLINLQ